MDLLRADRRLPRVIGRILIAAIAAVAVAHIAVAYFGVNAGDGAVDTPVERFFNTWVHNGLLVIACSAAWARVVMRASERGAWTAMAVAITAWSAGEFNYGLFLEGAANPPFPSLSDAFWLTTPIAAYVTLGMLMRSRVRDLGRELWLDGLIGALAVAAIGAALVFQPVLESSTGSPAAVATNLAYPLSDLLLLACIVTVFALKGWRPGPSWMWILAGFVTLAFADCIYLYRIASGTYVDGMFVDALWPLSMLMLAYSGWDKHRDKHGPRPEGWLVLALPITFTFVSLGLLVYGNFRPLGTLALILSAASLVAAVVRFGVTFRAMRTLMDTRRRESVTDPLTGLSNRRRLLADLNDFLQYRQGSRILALFDLDGFKSYNDLFGHPAGDDLLARLGSNLDAVTAPWGRAYRLGGDEFCILVDPQRHGSAMIMAAASTALSEQGNGFTITASCGEVRLPDEVDSSERALQVADQRMYAVKDSRRASPRHQIRDLLMTVLSEREPDLHTHSSGVTQLVKVMAEKFGLVDRALDDVLRAAELHDIGKVAIPEGILHKPAALDEEEWNFMRRHTLIGERILASAPALTNVAKLVRASHERWDGNGYPDGLAGEEIPLGSRIISICDAFDAMMSDRPYRRGIPLEAALTELRSCAGAQFDAEIVEAFCLTIEGAQEASRAGAPAFDDIPLTPEDIIDPASARAN